jgi:hypothetical protein
MNVTNAARVTARVTTPADLAAEMARCGYLAGPPPWLTAEAQAIDAACAADYECGSCGAAACHYRPFYSTSPRRYRAYACCGSCGHWEEF